MNIWDKARDECEQVCQLSAKEDRIVRLDYSEEREFFLSVWSEDYTNDDEWEFWASKEYDEKYFNFAGGCWRVHLTTEKTSNG